jgi:hypothetical protein
VYTSFTTSAIINAKNIAEGLENQQSGVKRSGHRYQGTRVRDRQAHCPRAMKILKKFNFLLDNIEAPPLLLSDINKFKNRYGRASEIFLHGIIQND